MPMRSGNGGFTLIEILIAVVIFAIGLLGIASLQIAGMRYTHGSQLRSAAVVQAESMSDLMRANEHGMRNGEYNFLNDGTSMPTSYSYDCASVSCSAADRATYDLVTWNQSIADLFPHATAAEGAVCRDSTPDDGSASNWACDNLGNVYAIKIEWQERSAGEWLERTDDEGEAEDVSTQRFVMTVLPALDEN